MIPADATLNLLMGAATSGMTGAQREDQGEIVHDKVIGIVCKGRGGVSAARRAPWSINPLPPHRILYKGWVGDTTVKAFLCHFRSMFIGV